MAAADKKAMKDEAKGAVKAPAAVIKLGVKDVKEMEGVVTAGRKGLSEGAKEALIAQEKKQSEENAEKVKPNDAAAKKLEKEEEKIEDTSHLQRLGIRSCLA